MKKTKRRILRKTRKTVLGQDQKVLTKLVKSVGKNSDNLGRIYLPGHWIGKKVKITILE
jgi:putative transposon-encoded protein